MSVAPLTAEELGLFAAWCVRLEICTLDDAIGLAVGIAAGNAGAYSHTYAEIMAPEDPEQIDRAARRRLRENDFSGHCGPLAYNMVANDGTAFVALGIPIQDNGLLAQVQAIEARVRKAQDAEAREEKRKEENAIAYNDVGQLGIYTAEEIAQACDLAGCQRVILARYRTDESESQSDYYGGRTTRYVVIGFGKGLRENFKQLRKAAAAFPPTAFLGPGRNSYCVSLVWDHNWSDDKNRAFIQFERDRPGNLPWKGQSVPVHWYKDEYDGPEHYRGWGFGFATQAEAAAFIAANTPLAGTEWRISCESYEHRENWSMGGGNYLGVSRYGGWQVYSVSPNHLGRNAEKGWEWWKPGN